MGMWGKVTLSIIFGIMIFGGLSIQNSMAQSDENPDESFEDGVELILSDSTAIEIFFPDDGTGIVGGQLVPVSMSSLFLVGIVTNAFWMIPTFGGIGAGIILYKLKNRI